MPDTNDFQKAKLAERLEGVMPSSGGSAVTFACPLHGSADVSELCDRLGIRESADLALDLAMRTLRPQKIGVEAGADPEGDGEWLVICADIQGSVHEVLQAYAACKKEWLAAAPVEHRHLVRFLYNIV